MNLGAGYDASKVFALWKGYTGWLNAGYQMVKQSEQRNASALELTQNMDLEHVSKASASMNEWQEERLQVVTLEQSAKQHSYRIKNFRSGTPLPFLGLE